MSKNVMNDTVMKAHQNRNMTYDEMCEYGVSMRLRNVQWISPSVAVLAGAELPLAPPTARGGGM